MECRHFLFRSASSSTASSLFFASRRRHTRYWRDWSSDVCSSDLPEAVLEHIEEEADLIAGMANCEPVTILDAMEANANRLSGVRIHQMLSFRKRRYMHGAHPGVRHVSWFLSPANREAFHKNTCDLVPNNFSEVPSLMRRSTRCSLVLATVSPPDRHGYFSLGTHADYAAAMIGEVPFFVRS